MPPIVAEKAIPKTIAFPSLESKGFKLLDFNTTNAIGNRIAVEAVLVIQKERNAVKHIKPNKKFFGLCPTFFNKKNVINLSKECFCKPKAKTNPPSKSIITGSKKGEKTVFGVKTFLSKNPPTTINKKAARKEVICNGINSENHKIIARNKTERTTFCSGSISIGKKSVPKKTKTAKTHIKKRIF
jgi:hypothetical protein